MFAYLKGTISEKNFNSLVVEVNGIGYQLLVSDFTISSTPDVGKEAKIYTYLQVKEDGLTLFGFYSNEEKKLFESLISVSGVGGKSALLILSGAPVNDLIISIVNEDVSLLSKVKGIGKKTAERIVLELKEKLADFGSFDSKEIEIGCVASNSAINESYQALIMLGVAKQDAIKMSKFYGKTCTTAEEIIQKVLQNMNK